MLQLEYGIHMSHDLGAVTIFRFLELGLGLSLRLGLGLRLGSGLGLRLGFWLRRIIIQKV